LEVGAALAKSNSGKTSGPERGVRRGLNPSDQFADPSVLIKNRNKLRGWLA